MATIRTLPDDVARQIAAGEVVERPASVVKELVENAVDAGARRIHIRTEAAGERLIEVADDGHGMSPEDVALAPRNFSTSKITSSDDLNRIGTYGFRGEALASISSVSRFQIVSSDQTNGEGWKLASAGKSAVANEPAPRERGTTVRVEELFFNTPARKRFLKTPLTERKRILDTILSFALVLPDIEIHYEDDGRHVLDLLPAHRWEERVAAVMGNTTMKHMVTADREAGPYRVRGFVSLPSYTRANRTQQFLFINRRYVREKTVMYALQDAYRNVIPYKRYPAAVLALSVPPEEVDVNVHPCKLEVRLRNEKLIFSEVRRAVKTAVSAASEGSMQVSVAASADEPKDSDGVPESTHSTPATLFGAPATQPEQKVISLQERIQENYTDYLERHPTGPPPAPFNPSLSLSAEPPTETREAVESLKAAGDDALFWQFNNTYIFIQVRGGVVVIDQHAAHERIIFDTAKRQLEGTAPLSQQILFRINLELSLGELEIFRSSQEVFRRLGFDLEPFGGKSILVRGYPQGLKNWDEGKLLLQVFDDVANERVPGDSISDRVIASFACRSAIKAGKKLTHEEMRMLADQLFAVENPYSCPHGRPTIHRIGLEEIEKWFQRR